MKFSTKDQDNDVSVLNCAQRWKGGWWFNDCYRSYLNGDYRSDANSTSEWDDDFIIWTFKDNRYPLKFTEMKLRPYKYQYS